MKAGGHEKPAAEWGCDAGDDETLEFEMELLDRGHLCARMRHTEATTEGTGHEEILAGDE